MQDPYKTMWHNTLNHLIKQLTMGDSVEGFAGIKSREVHSTTVLSKIAGITCYDTIEEINVDSKAEYTA